MTTPVAATGAAAPVADWANLNGQRVVSCTVTMPYYGAWVADVTLSVTTAIPTGLVTLKLGDMPFVGTVFRQFTFGGSRTARIVGGAGGWMKTVASRAYQNNAGVLLSTVLKDVATDSGETFGAATLSAIAGQSVGTAYMRETAPASRTLKQLGGPIWWIDQTGATQLVDRALLPQSGLATDTLHMGPIISPFTTQSWSGSKGKFVMASEKISDWMPGRTFSDANVTAVQTISLVTFQVDGGGSARIGVLAE